MTEQLRGFKALTLLIGREPRSALRKIASQRATQPHEVRPKADSDMQSQLAGSETQPAGPDVAADLS